MGNHAGIVGFFDVLGYQSFLANNDPRVSATTAMEIMSSVKTEVPLFLQRTMPRLPAGENQLQDLKWLVFSDTVLITSSPAENETDDDDARRWVNFLLSSCVLQRHMFFNGLPLRGGIAVGEFIVREMCFAGRPIVDAYRLGQDLELAATAFTSEAAQELENVLKGYQYSDALRKYIAKSTVSYLAPRKHPDGRRLLCVDFFSFPSPSATAPDMDVAQQVVEVFSKHDKDISESAVNKVRNTELFLRHLKMKHPQHWTDQIQVDLDSFGDPGAR